MKRFVRTTEDFACENCWAKVAGNGYTNHCPECLWSKHVDVNPGDRAEPCGGPMKPVGVETKGSEHTLTHRCILCGFSRRQTANKNDNYEEIIKLSSPHT